MASTHAYLSPSPPGPLPHLTPTRTDPTQPLLCPIKSAPAHLTFHGLTTQITQCAERFAPSNAWYIHTIIKVFELAGDKVRCMLYGVGGPAWIAHIGPISPYLSLPWETMCVSYVMGWHDWKRPILPLSNPHKAPI